MYLTWYRHRLSPSVGLEDFDIRWFAYHLRLYQRDPVLLGQSRCAQPSRHVPSEQSSRLVAMSPFIVVH